MKEVIKVFNELIETTLTNSSNNEAVITNVKLWAESWKKEMELAINYSRCCTQLRVDYEKGFCKWAESNCISTKKDLYEYNNRTYSLKQLEDLYDKEICKNP